MRRRRHPGIFLHSKRPGDAIGGKVLDAGVAEWQTRQTQNLLPVREWGFKSLHPHQAQRMRPARRFIGMSSANIHDRSSIERAYPRDAFLADGAANQKQPANELLRGLSIVSAPDEVGNFTLERASRHRGETGNAVFLAPFRPLPAQSSGKADPEEGYKSFIDRVIAAAPGGFAAAESPGPGDPRLHGLRQ